jgi:hypothetical protein
MNREIDALVAEHIFGWSEVAFNAEINAATGRTPSRTGGMDGRGFAWIPRYSEDIAAAFEVVERLWPDVEYMNLERYGKNWCFHVHYTAHLDDCYQGIADTAPMAIALAALKAKGVETEGRGE